VSDESITTKNDELKNWMGHVDRLLDMIASICRPKNLFILAHYDNVMLSAEEAIAVQKLVSELASYVSAWTDDQVIMRTMNSLMNLGTDNPDVSYTDVLRWISVIRTRLLMLVRTQVRALPSEVIFFMSFKCPHCERFIKSQLYSQFVRALRQLRVLFRVMPIEYEFAKAEYEQYDIKGVPAIVIPERGDVLHPRPDMTLETLLTFVFGYATVEALKTLYKIEKTTNMSHARVVRRPKTSLESELEPFGKSDVVVGPVKRKSEEEVIR